MKKTLLIFLFIPVFIYSQESVPYNEFNAGVYLGEDILIFPGASYLWGNTIYYKNNTLLDYQGGFALPTVFTGKIGVGINDKYNSAIVGVRPFPSSLYIQFTFRKKRLLSIEFMPPFLDWTPNANWPIILNYGYRW